MWIRKDLKKKARQIVKKNYWSVIIVCFILALVTGEFGMSTTVIERNDESIRLNISTPDYYTVEIAKPDFSDAAQTVIKEQVNSATKTHKYIFKICDAITYISHDSIIYGITLCVAAVIGIFFIVFIAEPLIVGGRRYFIKIREDPKTKISVLLSAFKKGQWANNALIMLMRNIYTFLWFLTIIGGFIKMYEYRMIPFILANNPDVKRKEVFALSKQMMKGNKWRTFVLDLSFIGWYILSLMTLGLLSVLYLNPYMATTYTELYIYLKEQAIKEKYNYYELLKDKEEKNNIEDK